MYKSIRSDQFNPFVQDESIHQADLDKVAKNAANKSLLPILIFPGLMSSALEVTQSMYPHVVGKRAWLNLKAMGLQSLYKGGPLQVNEESREKLDEYDEVMHEEYLQAVEAKNGWLRHVALKEDMVSEHDGIALKPVEGLDAVSYLLQSGSLARHVAWVFGPVLKVLKAAGYKEGVNLDAAPYDWRLPPHFLEERHGYLTATVKKVEELYENSNKTPVVLLCHSMGGKAAHYFLSFCFETKGRQWIDKYIHTYFPVGCPHIGAPQTMRGTIEGDTMGLDAFLSEQEGILLARSIGSLNWLHPGQLPKHIPTTLFVRREGILRVNISTMHVANVFRHRSEIPEKLRLAITFGDRTLYTKFYEPQGKDGTISFAEPFNFAAPPFLPSDKRKWDQTLVVALQEPGFILTKKQKMLPWSRHALSAPIRWTLRAWQECCPARVAGTVVTTAGDVAMNVVDKAAAMAGKASTVAVSSIIDLNEGLGRRNPSQFMNKIMYVTDRKKQKRKHMVGSQRQAQVTISCQWDPHELPTTSADDNDDRIECSPICESAPEAPTLSVTVNDSKNKSGGHAVEYESQSGRDLLQREELEQSLMTTRDHYDADPLGPLTMSSVSAPPVKRVKAVYSINVPTEIGSIYRRRNFVEQSDHVRSLYERDREAECDSPHYLIEEGVVTETSLTPQVLSDGTTVFCSGDGTVPYFSLQQSSNWKNECKVSVEEMEGVNHRDILGDTRFHKILIAYVTSAQRRYGSTPHN